jgi:hypothetical protein
MEKRFLIACSVVVSFFCLSPLISFASPTNITFYNQSNAQVQLQTKNRGFCDNAWIQPGDSQQCSGITAFNIKLIGSAVTLYRMPVYPISQTINAKCKANDSSYKDYIAPQSGVSKVMITTNSDPIIVTCPGSPTCNRTDNQTYASYYANIDCQ